MTTTFIDIVRKLSWNDDVQVISLRYDEKSSNLTVLNIGDGPIYLSHLSVKSKIPAKRPIRNSIGTPIDKMVPAHEFYTFVDTDYPDDVTKEEVRRGTFWRKGEEAIVSHVTDEAWKLMLENYQQDKCLNLTYYAANDRTLNHWKSFLGDNLRTFDAKAEITFISAKNGAVISRAVSAKGVLHFDQRPDCTN